MIKKVATYLFIVLLFSFLLANILLNWQNVASYSWRLNNIDTTILLIILSLMHFINALSWHTLMMSMQLKVDLVGNMRIWMYSNFSRMLPGVVWQYLGRVYLAGKYGVPRASVATALVIEIVLNLTAGNLIILLIVLFWGMKINTNILAVVLIAGSALGATITCLSNENIMRLLMSLISRLIRRKGAITVTYIPKKWVPVLLMSYSLQFIFDGSLLFYVSRGFIDLSISSLPIYVGIFAVSWLVGYITIFAPSGLGVQEVTMTTLLSFYMPFALASLIAIIFRLLLYVSEIFALITITLISKANYSLLTKRCIIKP